MRRNRVEMIKVIIDGACGKMSSAVVSSLYNKKKWLFIIAVFLPLLIFGQTPITENVIQVDTVKKVELYDIKAIANGSYAQWSPDGKKVAFVGESDKPPSLAQMSLGGDVWVINSDGKREAQKLTSCGYILDFVWSPDSKEIAYISNEYGTNPQSWLNVVNIKSGKARIIYGPWTPHTFYLREIRWLKDGYIRFFEKTKASLMPDWVVIDKFGKIPKKITSSEKIVYSDFNEALWIMNADGTEKKRLVWSEKPNISFSEPAWSKEAKKIAVNVKDSNAIKLAITDEDGKMWRILTDSGVGQEWSPDGKWIICFVFMEHIWSKAYNSELFLISPDGKHRFQLTKTPDIVESGAQWSPDGTKILFTIGYPYREKNIFIATVTITKNKE